MISAPANLRALAELSPEGGPRFPSLRHLRFIGGMPSRDLIAKLQRRCTPNIYISYAMTEVGVVAMATPETLALDPESTGPLQTWARLEAVDENDLPLPPEQEGEIRVRVEGMPTSYCLNVPADKNRFRNGWFYPGDRGFLGEDGLVRIKGRSDHLLNIGGRKFAPEYLEHILEEHPSVLEAAVFMESSPNGEQVPVAAVVTRGKPEPDALSAHCLEHLNFLAPKRYYYVTRLPRNLMSKLKREDLAGWVKGA
jgi:acyl-coenzyme A synthetase/AMP-(fatty) acid ligase